MDTITGSTTIGNPPRPALQPLRDRQHASLAAEHARLDRADRQIGKDSVDLGGDHVRRHIVHRRHALRVLRRYRRNDRGAVNAKRREGLQVRLEACARRESQPAMESAAGVVMAGRPAP